jgi:hypothetical protein
LWYVCSGSFCCFYFIMISISRGLAWVLIYWLPRKSMMDDNLWSTCSMWRIYFFDEKSFNFKMFWKKIEKKGLFTWINIALDLFELK